MGALITAKENFHAVSLSGGKDSTCLLLLMIERGLPIDAVIWADTGMEFPEMYGHISKVDEHLYRERWTCRLQAALGEDFLVLEEGLPGRTTVFDDPVEESLSALPYLYPCLMSHAPVSLLVVMLGTNDTKERLGANACAIGKGLRRLVRKAQSIDCWAGGQPNLLIVAPPAIGKGVERSPVAQEMGLGCVEKSLRLPGQFRAVAAETRCHFLDANALGLAHNPIDFMHLTRESHARLAAALAERIPTLF